MPGEARTPESPLDLTRAFRIADWTVRPDLNRLTRGDESLAIEPRVMRVLVSLAERPREVWTREELLEEVWGDVVIQEEALTHAISRLRRAFGDSARESRFIETIPKRGYRLIAPLSADPASSGERGEPAEGRDAGRSTGPPARDVGRGRLRAWALASVPLLVALVLAAQWLLGTDRSGGGAGRSHAILEGMPFTSYPGEESMPAVSPDGASVVFVRCAGEGKAQELFLAGRGGEAPRQLTDTPEAETWPRWAPDGDRVLFLRGSVTSTAVVVLSLADEREEVVFESAVPVGVGGADWLPSGDRLVLAVRKVAGGPCSLELFTLATGESKPLRSEPNAPGGDLHPVCAPDGERVAFVSSDLLGQRDIYCLDSLDGPPRRLTFGEGQIRGLDWTADGRSVIFSSGTAFAGEFRLWCVDVESGVKTWLPTRGQRSVCPSTAKGQDVLVYAEETYRRQVLRAPVEAGVEPEPLAPSSHSEYDAHYSPSGTRIAFVSTRTGHPEIFVGDRDGGAIRQVTSLRGPNPEFLQWSPDERYLAFDLMDGSRSAVHLTDVASGETRAATRSNTDEILHSWSRDGRSLYLRTLVRGEWRSVRASLETGELEEVLPHCTYMVAEEPGGGSLVFVRAGSRAVWRVSLGTREEVKVVEIDAGIMECYWKMLDAGLFFYRRTEEGPVLALHDLATGGSRIVCPLPQGRPGLLDVAPDGRSLLYDRVELAETDLVCVEPFQP